MMKKITLSLILMFGGYLAQAQVSTLYGDGTPSYSSSNSPAYLAKFNQPYGVAIDTKGNWWISDQANNFAVLIRSNVYYIREGYINGGDHDGAGAGSGGGIMATPKGIIVVPGATYLNDQIYLCDYDNNKIRKIDSFVDISHSQWESTVAGAGFSTAPNNYKEGVGKNALFHNPAGLGYVKDAAGGYLVVVDQGNNVIRKVSLHKADYGTTSLIAGVPNDTGFYNDGAALKAGFAQPEGIFVDAANNNDIYIAENDGGIRKISNGTVSTVVHRMNLGGATSVVKQGHYLYIGDGCRILLFDLTQNESSTNPSVVAGDPGDTTCDFNDATTNKAALFNHIASMTLSPDSKYLIIADQGNNRIRKMILGTTAIEDITPVKDVFTVYPNPAFGHVQVKSEISGNAVISLVDLSGRTVLSTKANLQSGVPFDIDITNRVPGVYVLQVATGSGVYSSRIVVK
jgi:hypothetical protein